MEQPSGDTPSVTPVGRDSSLREGAGRGAYHSTCRPETARFRAIFIAPTKLCNFLPVTSIGGHSLSQPFGLTAPSGREPGMGCAIQPGGRKLRRCGRFSSPLRRGGCHSLGKSGVGADAPTPLGVSGRDEITLGYLAQASIWLWISAMMSSRPESRMVASMVATVCSGSWVPVIRMGRYSL